jgi:hypothetical protein
MRMRHVPGVAALDPLSDLLISASLSDLWPSCAAAAAAAHALHAAILHRMLRITRSI